MSKRLCIYACVALVLTGSGTHAEAVYDMEQIIVEASRSNDTRPDMNRNVWIITAEDIAASPGKNLAELLKTVPGVHIRVNSSRKDQTIDMGGFGEAAQMNVLVLIDGRRVNLPDLSGADLSLIDVNAIERIEILQGANTVLYGDNATGGVINIVTKKGKKDAKPSVTLSTEFGSYKSDKQSLELSGGLSTLGYQFNYSRQDSNNYRTQNTYWANDFNTRLNYDPTDVFGIDFAQGYHLDRYRLPGGISLAEIETRGPTGINAGRISYGTTSDAHFDVSPRLKFGSGTTEGEVSLFTSARKRLSNFNFPAVGYNNYKTEEYEFQPKVIVSSPLTDRLDNKVTGGYDFIYTRQDRRMGSPGNPEDIVFARETMHGVYLLDELTLDERWLLNLGARGSWAEYTFDQKQQSAVKFTRSDTVQGYEGGLGYKYNPDSKIYFNYAHSYRLPVLDEFFQAPFSISGTPFPAQMNTALTYQEGNQYQVGVRDQSFKDVRWGLSFTTAQYKNEIYDDPNVFNTNYSANTRHYTETADVAVMLFDKKVEPFANVTLQQAHFRKGPYSGSQIPAVPEQVAQAGITYRPFEGLSTTLSTDFVGESYGIGDDPNRFSKVKRYETLDWQARYEYKNFEVWLSLRNLLDEEYYVYSSSFGPFFGGPQLYYPAPGRNASAGVKVKF